MWKFIECVKQGRGHVRQGIPCQDKTFSQSNGETYAIALADGAGSASHSHYGAECVTKCIVNELNCNFESYWDEEDARIAKDRLFKEINESLQEVSCNLDCNLKDLASTLLAVAVKDDRYILLHLGDGVIGYYKDGQLKVASAPDNGEFANTTVFTTSFNAGRHAKIFRGELGNINGFVLMSDGPEACLYNYQKQELAKGLTEIFEDASANDVKNVTDGVQEAMDTVISNHTMDDCSLAFIVKTAERGESETIEGTSVETKGITTSTDEPQNENASGESLVTSNDGTDKYSHSGENASPRRYLVCISIIAFILLIVYILL